MRRLLGLLRDQLGEQPLQRRERAPLHAVHLARPVLELTVEEVPAVAQEPEPRPLRIDAVDRRDLLDHAA